MTDKNDLIGVQMRMFRLMRTVHEMCIDRKMPGPEQWVPKNIEDFRARYCNIDGSIARDRMMLDCRAVSHEDAELNGNVVMMVFFNGEASVGAKEFAMYRESIPQGPGYTIKRIIIVHSGKLNPAVKSSGFLNSSNNQVRIECIEEQKLIVNITHHELVPKHEPLSPSEAKDVLKAYSLELSMLPRILSTDPVVEYFGLERGRVFRITRKSETAGEYVTYRQVV
eukprot:Tbor_TRINITY_DN5489_c4_g2::TRINITY_DN5489_c4_g2_i3::g.24482::m.24482/K03013/RPB5, POLR2E; DNA-directed RNA polymerases I, II, and III subunit RPABC1